MSTEHRSQAADQVDVRGPRFAAWVTTAVLATLLVSGVSLIAAAVILGVQAVVFAIGASRGPRKHPYGLLFATLRRAPARPGHRAGTGAAAEVRPAGRLRLRRRRRRRLRRRCPAARPGRHRVRAGRGLPQRGLRHLPRLPALPVGRPTAPHAHPRVDPKHQATERISSMARSDVLVTADWAESNLDAPNTVFVEVDEDTTAYDGGHIAGAVKLDWKTDLQDPVRRDFVDAAAVLQAAVGHAASPTTTP